MGWAFCGTDDKGRDIGYGVPAVCDVPGCGAEIDRGLACPCGRMHCPTEDGEGCGGYYCGLHLYDHGCTDPEYDPLRIEVDDDETPDCPPGTHAWKTHVSPSTPDDPGGERETHCVKCGAEWSEERGRP